MDPRKFGWYLPLPDELAKDLDGNVFRKNPAKLFNRVMSSLCPLLAATTSEEELTSGLFALLKILESTSANTSTLSQKSLKDNADMYTLEHVFFQRSHMSKAFFPVLSAQSL